jgi:hypothetical protein
MTRRFQLTICALFVLSVAGHFALTSAGQQDPKDPPAEKFFKNIKALNGLPASEVLKQMIAYDKALGVDCDYCHTFPDLADDSKPAHKDARHDILMTGKIRAEFQRSVDCMSCHQGKAKIGGPVLPPPPPPPPPVENKGLGPDEIPYSTAYGPVQFPHRLHQKIDGFDCTKCHHTGENSSCTTSCHLHNKKPSGITKISFTDVAHGNAKKYDRACADCHLIMGKGPTQCRACHK